MNDINGWLNWKDPRFKLISKMKVNAFTLNYLREHIPELQIKNDGNCIYSIYDVVIEVDNELKNFEVKYE